jgi:hypothetical protein
LQNRSCRSGRLLTCGWQGCAQVLLLCDACFTVCLCRCQYVSIDVQYRRIELFVLALYRLDPFLCLQIMSTAAVDAQYLQDRNAHAKPVTVPHNPDLLASLGATYGFHPKKHLSGCVPDVHLTPLASKVAVVEASQLIYSSGNDDYRACNSMSLIRISDSFVLCRER